MKRAVGYCNNTDCEDFAKGVFLLNHGNTFYCPRCRAVGDIVPERGSYTGNTGIWKEVRVEFDYDSIQKKFKQIAIIRDESLLGEFNVYTLFSPLIKTETRALKVSEVILANLNRYHGLPGKDEIPEVAEHVLSLDDDRSSFSKKLGVLAHIWEESKLC